VICYRACRRCPTPVLDIQTSRLLAKRVCNHVDCPDAPRHHETWSGIGAGERLVSCPACGRTTPTRTYAVDVPVRCLCGNEFIIRGRWPAWLHRLWWLVLGPRRDVYPPVVEGPYGVAHD